MSNKLKALIQTSGFFALAAIGAIIFVSATMWIPIEYIVYTLIFGTIAYGFWFMYKINLDNLERKRD